MAVRQMPWEPSQPQMKSQSSRRSRPSDLHVTWAPSPLTKQVDAFVHEPVFAHTRVEPELGQRVDSDLLEHAGSYSTFDIRAGVSLEHHTVDTSCFKKMRQKHTGRAGADDGDLGSHEFGPPILERTSVQTSVAR